MGLFNDKKIKIASLSIGVTMYIASFFYKIGAGWDLFTLISVPLIIIPLGLSFKDKFINGKFDISYGIYVYAFPIQQLYSNTANLNFFSSLSLSIITVLILATTSWVYIEKPFLKRKENFKIDAIKI